MITLTIHTNDKFYLCGRDTRQGLKVEKYSEGVITLSDAIEEGRYLMENWELTDLDVCSATTGEVYAEFHWTPDEVEDEPYDDYDEVGYNPYIGCYDYDC